MNIPRNTPSQAVIDLLPRFPALWEVEIQLGAGSNQGSQFLDMVRARLDRIKKVILVLWITRNETKHAYDLTKATAENVLREECRCGYGEVLDVPDGYLGREMQLEYQAPKANYQRFGAPGILRLTLEKL